MNILLLSNATPNNILAQKILESHHCSILFNHSEQQITSAIGTNISINLFDFNAFEAFCLEQKIGLVIIHRIDLLQKGLFDFLQDDERIWKGIIMGCSKKIFSIQHISFEEIGAYITDGKTFLSLENKNNLLADEQMNKLMEQILENNIEVKGFIQLNKTSISPCLINEEEILNKLETDLVSIFAATNNGTLEDVNIEFFEK